MTAEERAAKLEEIRRHADEVLGRFPRLFSTETVRWLLSEVERQDRDIAEHDSCHSWFRCELDKLKALSVERLCSTEGEKAVVRDMMAIIAAPNATEDEIEAARATALEAIRGT